MDEGTLKLIFKKMAIVWDVFTFADVVLIWLSIPVVVIFAFIGTLYWLLVRPIKMLRRRIFINKMTACGLDKSVGKTVVEELEIRPDDGMQTCESQELVP